MADSRRRRLGCVVVAATAALAVLGGCGAQAPGAAPTSPPAPATSSAPPTPTRTPSPDHTVNAPRGDPVRVVVTATDGTELVDAPVRPQGLDPQGVLAPPPGVVGWYDEQGWPKPGFPGASILAGHVNSPENGDDTFARLPEATAGATVTVTYDSGDTVEFEITRSAAVPKSRTPKDDSIWDAGNPRPLIRLITCDPTTPLEGGHYVGNWVLWGEPA